MIRWRLVLAAVLGALLALWLLNHTPLIAQDSVPDSLTVQAQVSAADHELDEGYFQLAEGLAVSVDPEQQPVLYRYLVGHRDGRVVVTFRERRGLAE